MSERYKEPENRIFRAWARFVLRHRLLIVFLTLAVTGVFVNVIRTRITTDMTIEAFLDSSSETLRTLEEFRDLFGRDDIFMVLVRGDVFSGPFMERFRALHNELSGIDLKLESLGQRLGDRRSGQETAAPAPPAPPGASGTAARKAAGHSPPAEADDGFADFDTGDESGAKKAAASDAASGWGDEAGGSIVDEIVSLVNVRRTRGRTITRDDGSEGMELVVGELMKPWPPAARLPALRREVLADKTLVGQVVDSNGRIAVIAVRTQFMSGDDSRVVFDHIKATLGKHEAKGFSPMLSGTPGLSATLTRLLLSEIQRLFVFAVLAVTLILVLLFRHPLAVAGPLVVVMLSLVWTFGIMAATGLPITMLTNVLPAFIICVGVGNSIHIITVYRDRRRQGVENREAIVSAVGATGTPVFFTCLTTAVGLLSFQFASIDAIGAMGLAGAFGVGAALIQTLVLLPIFLSLNRNSLFGTPGDGASSRIDRFLNFCAALSGRRFDAPPDQPPVARRRRATLVAVIVLTCVAVGGGSMLRVWHNPLSWLPADEPIRRSFDIMDRHVGGTATIQLVIRSKSARGVKDLRLMQGLERFQRHLLAYEHPEVPQVVGNSISLLDVVKETNRALHGGDDRHYRLPGTQRALADTLFLFEQAGPDQLRRLASADLKITQMTVRVRWMEATSYGHLTRYVNKGIAEHLDEVATVKTTGTAYTLFMTVSSLIMNLLRSFSVALVFIAVIMIILLKNIRLGLIAMVPNLLPIIFILGLMGFVGVPIDMANLLIASIAIGLAVDDTIHFLHHYREHFDENGDVEAAIAHSFRHSGRAMVGTTLVLSVGFGVFVGSSLLSLQRFGALIGATVIFALLIDLIFSPALLRTFYTSKENTGAQRPVTRRRKE